MKRSILFSTVRHDFCIGCGVCELVCPEKAISIAFSSQGEFVARVDASRCTDCGICADFCPHSRDTLRAMALRVAEAEEPLQAGLENADCYLAFDRGPGRCKSASGGITTRLLGDWLDAGRLEGVIHGESLVAPEGEPHFQAAFSASSAELDDRRGSFYAPICFSPVVETQTRFRSRRLVMVATPCVVRAYRKLFAEHPEFSENRVFFVALVCSHNTSHHFTDFLYRSMGLPKGQPFRLEYRSKESIPHAGRFRIRVQDAERRVLAHPDRMECAFTRAWRSYAFALKACHYCADFWGVGADMSVKDAWGKWAQDPKGTSLVAVKNDEWRTELPESSKALYLEELDTPEFVKSQTETVEYRQAQVIDRWKRSVLHPCNLRSQFARHRLVAAFSRMAWPRLGVTLTYFGIRFWGSGYDVLHRVAARSRAFVKALYHLLATPFTVLKWPGRAARFKRGIDKTKVLMVGGYGYGNLGDEAQLHTTWRQLEKAFPDRIVKVLTPNPESTRALHGCTVGEAPRLAFFDVDTSPTYGLGNRKRHMAFILRGISIYFNALLMRCGLPPFMLVSRRSALLDEIRNASMVFFCGGGYLTGATRSRLWDGALLGRLAHLFRVPLVLSGQTMGLWGGRFSRFLAHWGFSNARLIGLRDPVASPKDLEEAGIHGDHVMVTHDDALFSATANRQVLESVLEKCGLSPDDRDLNYRVFQFHYWGMNSPERRIQALDQAAAIVRLMRADGVPLVLVSMTPVDDIALGDLQRRCPDLELPAIIGERDFRVVRSVIGNAKICVAMKHHPLVFALGEGAPVISLARGSYYVHKNSGLLKLYNLSHFCLNLEYPDYLESFRELLDEVEREDSQLRRRIDLINKGLRDRGFEFWRRIQGASGTE